MGIKGLWGLLTPHSEKKSLHEIRGETIAVDLSGWVCDSQNVTDYHIQPKLYLRNLFFRTIYLLLADINPVFVLEGDAPELKRDVMAARNELQFRGAAPRAETTAKKKPDVSRKRFKTVLKECESLLRCMGVRCVKGRGEAEATCAQLNVQGLVDGVVSQDSDCFAYGARRVYRNFSVSSAAGGGAVAGSVDYYDADTVLRATGFGRNKMVALAILCGCDYGVGACGSSITTVLSFLHTVSDNEIIPRLLSWVSDPGYYEERTRWVSVPGRCDRCGHAGRTHGKKGCPVCATHCGCNDTGHKAKVAEVKRELSLRSRAISTGETFPEPKVIKEFLNPTRDEIDLEGMKTPAPSLIQFTKLMTNKLEWSERYCVEKYLPLLTKWHLQEHVPCRTIKPMNIKKKRNPRGVPSYEVVWGDIDGQYEALIPDEQFEEGEDPSVVWRTTEKQDLMRRYYPELVEAFEESIRKPPKEKKTKKKKDGEKVDAPKRKYNKKVKKVADKLADCNITMNTRNISVTGISDLNSSKVTVSVKKLKRKLKAKTKGQKTMDSFISNKRRKSSNKTMLSLRNSFLNLSLNCDAAFDGIYTEANEKENASENKHLLSMLNSCENDISESDLSDVVDAIITRAPVTKTAKVDKNIFKLVFDKFSSPRKPGSRRSVLNEIYNNCSTPKDSPIRRNSFKYCANMSATSKLNTSYFFDKLKDDRDAFEISMEYKHISAVINIDCDTTVDYSLPDVCL